MDYTPNRETPLTLSHIKVLDENYQLSEIIHDFGKLNEWAGKLGVNPPAILFQGKLNDEQKVKIQEFLFTPANSLIEKFKTVSFTKHIMAVLDPPVDEMAHTKEYERSIDEIVFRFFDDNKTANEASVLAKLVDPVFYDNAKQLSPEKVQRKSDDYIWIIVIDLMNFIEGYRISELREFVEAGETPEERYVSLINRLFAEFIKEYG
jgi:hypothetical protein